MDLGTGLLEARIYLMIHIIQVKFYIGPEPVFMYFTRGPPSKMETFVDIQRLKGIRSKMPLFLWKLFYISLSALHESVQFCFNIDVMTFQCSYD